MALSNLLAENFIRGAEEAGHTVRVIDAAHAGVSSVYRLHTLRL